MPNLETLELSPNSTNIDASIIWMHGLGADGHDFESVVEELNIPDTRFILPHAPYRAVSINNGYQMRAWYDIFGLELNSQQDEVGIRESQSQIETLITKEMARGVPANHIVLAGFSQGGAIALHTAIRQPRRLAGVLALSTYLPLKPRLEPEMNPANAHLPIFMAHGTFDNVISLEVSKVSAALLKQHEFALSWHEYPMAHSLCMEEIADIRSYLESILNR